MRYYAHVAVGGKRGPDVYDLALPYKLHLRSSRSKL